MKRRFYFLVMSILSFCLSAAGQTDTRIKVTSITGTSNIADVMVYGNPSQPLPTFTTSEGCIANYANNTVIIDKKNDADEWEIFNEATYTAGTYRVRVQARVDGIYGSTHVLAKGWTATVDGQAWTTNTQYFTVLDTYSYDYAISPDIVIGKGEVSLIFNYNDKYKIYESYVGRAIASFSVVDGVIGGEKPYTFSKTSGPNWISVTTDGTVSGMPDVDGKNADLVVRVTDNKSEWKEISIPVGYTYINPANREDVTSITGTSNIAEVMVEGNTFIAPTITASEGSVAYFEKTQILVYKKDDADVWRIYSEPTYTPGIYSVRAQVRVDGASGHTHKLAEGWTATVDGQAWSTGSVFFVDDQYSCDLAISPDIQLKKDTGIEQVATDNRVADIHTISGVRVKRNATTDNLKTLPAGIYIIGNRKVMVK